MKISFTLSIAFIFLCTSSCGYRMSSLAPSERLAVSVPLIRIDDNGIFRDALAKELSNSGKFNYRSNDARYQLKVSSTRDKKETIGYAWDRDPKSGALLDVLYATEEQRSMDIEVSLYDTVKKKQVGKSIKLSRNVYYDYVNPTATKWIFFTDGAGVKQTTLQYSLGQLDSQEGAEQESYRPLYQALAKEIIYLLEQQSFS